MVLHIGSGSKSAYFTSKSYISAAFQGLITRSAYSMKWLLYLTLAVLFAGCQSSVVERDQKIKAALQFRIDSTFARDTANIKPDSMQLLSVERLTETKRIDMAIEQANKAIAEWDDDYYNVHEAFGNEKHVNITYKDDTSALGRYYLNKYYSDSARLVKITLLQVNASKRADSLKHVEKSNDFWGFHVMVKYYFHDPLNPKSLNIERQAFITKDYKVDEW